MRTLRLLTRAALVLALLLASLMLAPPSADAVPSGPTCDEGTLISGDCVVTGSEPIAGPASCPVSATVFLDGNLCYERVDATPTCPVQGTTLDPDGRGCRTEIDLVPGLCAGGFFPTNDTCLETLPTIDTCTQGVLADGECEVLGNEPIFGPSFCPVSATVLLDGTLCYRVVERGQPMCPAAAIENVVAGECRLPVPLAPGSLVCEVGFSLEAGECIGYELQIPTCPAGTLDDGLCIIVGNPPVSGPASCPVSAVVLLDGAFCYRLSGQNIDGSCTPPDVQDPSGTACRTPEPLSAGPLTCEAGLNLVSGQCVRSEPAVPTCDQGTLDDFGCRIVGNPPVSGPASCPVSAVVQLDGDLCYRLVAKVADCPPGAIDAVAGTECREPVPFSPGLPMCEAGFGLIDGQCVRFESPVPGCPVNGNLTDDGTQCFVLFPFVPGPLICPTAASDGIIEDETGCYGFQSTVPVCDAAAILDPASEECLVTVPLTPGGLSCEASFGLIGGECLRFDAPVYRCAGQLVTINMRTGASGEGTSARDVILGTGGADTINARGGDDLICAGGGDDDIRGAGGDDVIYGQAGADTISGGSGADAIFAGGGDDFVTGGSGADAIRGGSGSDDLRGNGDNDDIRGNSGDDTIRGGQGDDTLRGGADNDDLRGSGGSNDSCIGGAGTDTAAVSCESIASTP